MRQNRYSHLEIIDERIKHKLSEFYANLDFQNLIEEICNEFDEKYFDYINETFFDILETDGF